jgi:hypothetical protein
MDSCKTLPGGNAGQRNCIQGENKTTVVNPDPVGFGKKVKFVADHMYTSLQSRGSGMFIPDPGSRFLILSIPGLRYRIQQQEKFSCPTFFVATNVKKLKIILVEMAKKKNLSQLTQKFSNFYPKKCSLSSQKYEFGIRDP